LPDMPSPTVGRVTPLDASFAVVSLDLAEGRWSLTVQYTEDGLRVLDEQLICNYMPHGIRHLSFKGFRSDPVF
ncbi:MAG: hypothetical protein AAF984_11475, partial [Verrucomicrobiota bacterium]